jgi:hypothetical protein
MKQLIENIDSIIAVLAEERNVAQMIKATPKRFKERAEEVKVKLLTVTNKGKYMYSTFTPSSGQTYKQFVKPVPGQFKIGSINDDVIVHCSCPHFKYTNEVSLWMANASQIISSNGQKPVVTNKGMKKMVCKHLVAVLNDLKKRLKE